MDSGQGLGVEMEGKGNGGGDLCRSAPEGGVGVRPAQRMVASRGAGPRRRRGVE
jgi:hypothetical protein